MALPSKYSSTGLLSSESRRSISSGGGQKRSKPIEFVHRRINAKVNDAAQLNNRNTIEMVPMNSIKEANAISDYVQTSRAAGQFDHDEMDMDPLHLIHRETFVVSGNMSYLVVDTNFILSHLEVVDKLRKLAKEHRHRIVIPITVIQELDGLKNSRRVEKVDGISTSSMSHLARWANDWIYNCFANKDPGVIGQAIDQRINRLAAKDDAILDCALYIKRENPKTVQVLMTNDKNLCAKALLNDILTVSYRDGMSAERIALMISHENYHRFGDMKEHTVVKERHVEVPNYSSTKASAVIYQEVFKLAKSLVHHCMKQSYGDDLSLIRGYDTARITTLEDVLDVISRFWRAVFSQYFGSSTYKMHFDTRYPPIEFCTQPDDKESFKEFVTFWSGFLEGIIEQELDSKQRAQMHTILQRWADMTMVYSNS